MSEDRATARLRLILEHGQGFNPFTATIEEARAQPDANEDKFEWDGDRSPGAFRRWEQAQAINALRPYLDEANPIDLVARCVSEGLAVPAWLAIPFLEQYQRVVNGEVATWDEAFGPARPHGLHLNTVALRAKHRDHLHRLFPDGGPRTKERRRHAAEQLNSTWVNVDGELKPVGDVPEKFIENWIKDELPPAPPIRTKKRRANDPFGQLPDKRKRPRP